MKICIMLMGPQGSGKTTYCEQNFPLHLRISQDEMGRIAHFQKFEEAIQNGVESIVVDRINHSRSQRGRYLSLAKQNGYYTKIVWLNIDRQTCLKRIKDRENHPTLDYKNADKALSIYFKQLEYPSKKEANEISVIGDKPSFAPVLDITPEIGDRRYVVVGDIHGCFNELKTMLDLIGFDRENDVLVCTGDIGDRGPLIKETFDFLLSFPRVYSVLGNHDDKMVRHYRGSAVSVKNGLQNTLDAIGSKMDEDMLDWFSNLPFILKVPDGYVVHAGFNPHAEPEEQMPQDCLYMRYFGGKNYFDASCGTIWFKLWPKDAPKVFFGHIPNDNWAEGENTISLDGGCVFGGNLRAWDSKTGKVYSVKAEKNYDENIYAIATSTAFDPIKRREEYVIAGLLRCDTSDDGKLKIYNYTDQCTFEQAWDDVTLNSRGHVFNIETGECVASPFAKFFNLNENETTAQHKMPWGEPFEIFEKLDGWLGVLYRHDNKFKVASRGSFHSEGSKWATEFIQTKNLSFLPDEVTLCFEIISKRQKIILDYDEETLPILAAFNRFTGQEYPRAQVEEWAKKADLPITPQYRMTIEECLSKVSDEKREGFVIRFANGTRVKIKTEWYLKIAKMMSTLSPISIWEAMKNGKVQETYLKRLPEQIRTVANTFKDHLEKQYQDYESKLKVQAQELVSEAKTVKELATLLNENRINEPIRGASFILFKGKGTLEKLVMARIYPKGNEFTVI